MSNTSGGRLFMKLSILRLVSITIGGMAIMVVCVYINYINLIEAFGSGPPYFNRTVNMDKWSDPIPFLVVLDSTVIAIFCGVFWFFTKFKKKGDINPRE